MEVEATAGVPESVEQFTARRDAAIAKWLKDKAILTPAKDAEAGSRQEVTTICFPDPKKGTNRYHLNGGYAIKLVHGTTYTLGDKDKVEGEGEAAVKVPVRQQVEAVLGQIALLGNRGPELAASLVKWKPELEEKAYLALSAEDADETDKKAKELIDTILTTKPASPQLTFEEPKKK